MNPEHVLHVYAELAELYDRGGQPKHRDWFLVLAADAALSAGRSDEADRLLGRLLSLNPHHFLRPFGSFAEAMRSADVQGYVTNLKRNYPPQKAAQLLESESRRFGGTVSPQRPALFRPSAPPDEDDAVAARMRGSVPEPDPLHTLAPPPRQAPPPQQPAYAPPPQPSYAPRAQPPVRQPPSAPEPEPYRASAPAQAAPPPEAPATSSAVPYMLFVVMLVLTVGVTAYTFARPFFPAEWLP